MNGRSYRMARVRLSASCEFALAILDDANLPKIATRNGSNSASSLVRLRPLAPHQGHHSRSPQGCRPDLWEAVLYVYCCNHSGGHFRSDAGLPRVKSDVAHDPMFDRP